MTAVMSAAMNVKEHAKEIAMCRMKLVMAAAIAAVAV
jgi:hypothetical protein